MKARSYLVALVDGGGSVPPELGAVSRLVARGHCVTVLAEDSTRAEVQASGATFRPWRAAPNRPDRRPENDPWRDWECKSPLQLFARMLETQLIGPAAGYAADLNAAVGDHRPDAVLCSQFALGAMMASEAATIPVAVLMPNIYLLPAQGLPPLGLGLRPARTVLGRLRDRVIRSITTRLWDRGVPALNALRERAGLPRVRHLWDQVHRAKREVVMTSPAFDFPGRVPANARYVGPVLDDPSWSAPWSPPTGEGHLVLVAMSSTFQDQAACLQRVVDALGTLAVRAIVTTGPAMDRSALRAPPNVTLVASAPHSQVLRHARGVVTHGGHGTVMKALVAGVPMVVMHHGRDQSDNATRIVARDAGLAVARTAKPAAIARAVRAILEDRKYEEGARRLGEAIRRDADGDALVRELEAVPD